MFNREIRAFTGLRGLAALFVALYHFKIYNFFSGTGATFFLHGYIAVDLFFILSGFVMALSHEADFKNGIRWEDYRHYLIKRVARIYPLYAAVTLFYIALYCLFPDKAPASPEVNAWNITSNMMMIQSWGISDSFVGPAWSISSEWAAYLLFPLIIVCFQSLRWLIILSVACLLMLSCMAILPTWVISHKGPMDIVGGQDNFGGLARCFFEFMLGVATYRATRYPAIRRYMHNRWISLCTAITLIALLAVPDLDILIIALLPVLLLSVVSEKSFIAKTLSSKPLYWLGTISYSLYMVHMMTFFFSRRLENLLTTAGFEYAAALTLITQVLVSLITAQITFWFIESPFRARLRQWLVSGNTKREEAKRLLNAKRAYKALS